MLVPIFLTNVPHLVGLSMPVALQKQIELMVFGALIVFFLIVEPNGLARHCIPIGPPREPGPHA